MRSSIITLSLVSFFNLNIEFTKSLMDAECVTNNAQNIFFYSEEKLRQDIDEVFLDHAEKLVYNAKSKRFDVIRNYYSRIEIVTLPKQKNEKIKELRIFLSSLCPPYPEELHLIGL